MLRGDGEEPGILFGPPKVEEPAPGCILLENGIEQLAAAMSQIKQASTQVAAGMRQVEISLRDLTDMSHQLDQTSVQYQL